MNARIALFASFSLALFAPGCFLDRSPLPGPSSNVDAGHDAGHDAGRSDGGGGMDAQVPIPDAGPSDGGRDGGPPDAGMSDGGCGGIAPHCVEGHRLVCVGGMLTPEMCDLGCVDGVCRRLVPSNVGETVRMDAGSGALTGTALVFDTGTGRITDGETEVRAAGDGVLADIAYLQVAGPDDAPGLGVFVVGSLDLPATGTLRAQGDRAFVLLVAGDANIAGSIDVSSNGLEGGPGGWRGHEGPGRGGEGADSGSNNDDSGGGGGGFGTAGGLGGPSGDRTPGAAGVTYGSVELIPLVGGSGGGRGGKGWRIDGTNLGGTGGGGGGAIQISVGGTLTVSGVIDAGGAAGAGGRSAVVDSGAGGGGGSGGAILLEALEVEMSGTLAVNGGGGGQGVTCSGCCSVAECGNRAESGAHGDAVTVPALGGGTGSAQAGGAGSNPGGNASPGGGAENGGGGGGGAGRIHINAQTPADVSVTGTIYPRATTGTITIGP